MPPVLHAPSFLLQAGTAGGVLPPVPPPPPLGLVRPEGCFSVEREGGGAGGAGGGGGGGGVLPDSLPQ